MTTRIHYSLEQAELSRLDAEVLDRSGINSDKCTKSDPAKAQSETSKQVAEKDGNNR